MFAWLTKEWLREEVIIDVNQDSTDSNLLHLPLRWIIHTKHIDK